MKKRLIIGGLLAVSAGAQAEPGVTMSGDWGRGINRTGSHYASTINPSGSALGQLCSSQGNCWYTLKVSEVRCNKDTRNIGLAASTLGSESIPLRCIDGNVYVIEDFDDMDFTVRNAASVGIVIPLVSGEFSVSRFSLRGSTYAIDGMRAAAQRTTDQRRATPAVRGRTADIRI